MLKAKRTTRTSLKFLERLVTLPSHWRTYKLRHIIQWLLRSRHRGTTTRICRSLTTISIIMKVVSCRLLPETSINSQNSPTSNPALTSSRRTKIHCWKSKEPPLSTWGLQRLALQRMRLSIWGFLRDRNNEIIRVKISTTSGKMMIIMKVVLFHLRVAK